MTDDRDFSVKSHQFFSIFKRLVRVHRAAFQLQPMRLLVNGSIYLSFIIDQDILKEFCTKGNRLMNAFMHWDKLTEPKRPDMNQHQ